MSPAINYGSFVKELKVPADIPLWNSDRFVWKTEGTPFGRHFSITIEDFMLDGKPFAGDIEIELQYGPVTVTGFAMRSLRTHKDVVFWLKDTITMDDGTVVGWMFVPNIKGGAQFCCVVMDGTRKNDDETDDCAVQDPAHREPEVLQDAGETGGVRGIGDDVPETGPVGS